MFYVEYFIRAVPEPYTETETLAQAMQCVRYLKNRGYTVWVLDSDRKFYPVKGVMRDPRTMVSGRRASK